MRAAHRHDAVVVGGGPAGLLTGLLLARAGVDVAVLEKHADFLRDFRGDTVHASTLAVLDELGLGAAFAALPHREQQTVRMELDDGAFTLADFRRLPGRHPHIAFVPQWDLLDLLAREASRSPSFTLERRCEVVGVLRAGRRVTGVAVRRDGGPPEPVRARVTIAADGRSSAVRAATGLPVRALGAPIDVLWFRLPAAPGDPTPLTFRLSRGALSVLIPREGYWQIAFVVAKGGAGPLLADGGRALRSRFARLAPAFADRVALLSGQDVRVLDVRLERLRRWSAPGVLCIGDAAHAMSPVAGVGINLAVQDAVATANLLAGPLRDGADVDRLLPRVQRRRLAATVLTQEAQRQVHERVLRPWVLDRSSDDGSSDDGSSQAAAPGTLPLPVRAVRRVPALAHLTGRFIGLGLLPEHVRSPGA